MIEVALSAQVLIWLVVIGLFLATGQASLFHPAIVYLTFHGLVFVLRPILVHNFSFDSNWEYMRFKPTDENFIRTLMVTSVAMICFVTACTWKGWTRTVFLTKGFPTFSLMEQRALVVTTLLLLPLAAYSIYATRNGIKGERVNGIYILTQSTGYINEAQHFIMPILCAWMVVTRFHWLNLFPTLIYITYRAWFGWSRWTILLFMLMVTLTYCWYHGKKWIPAWSVIVAIPILILFNILGHNRDILKNVFLGEEVQVVRYDTTMTPEEKLKLQLDTQDYANFDYLSYVVSVVPERTGTYSFGAQYLQLFTEPIPRILWKGKPVGAPVKTISLGAYGNFVGLTVSLPGDGWISGGWVGVVLTLSLAGTLLGWAHRKFWTHSDHRMGCLLYFVALAMVPQWYRDGGISISKFLLFTVTPVIIWTILNWLLGQRFVPGHSIILQPGSKVRVIKPEQPLAVN
ncbi:MAG: hypothetical protein SFY81_06810 [Verrucomicrobiota bacterium]|nr:hypothetical protein [Verrucomicrobiota bacterium]